ncbi:MAG: RsiV family protein [Ignavibacteria bacterium]
MKKIFLLVTFLCISCHNLFAQSMNVYYKTVSDKCLDLNYGIIATYPQVDFGPDGLMGLRGIEQDINNSMDTTINGIIQNFKNEVAQLPNKTVMNGLGSSLEITSTANVISGTILSANIKAFSAVAGAAHPITITYTYNYSTTATGLLSISDLFIPNSDFVNYLSDYSIADLRTYAYKQGYSIDNMITQGASPEIKNFNAWNLTVDSLVITFNPYQVALYVFGIQTVSIPLSNMINMIDPNGPLAFMFR